jgi:hypothetical protein
MIFLHHFIICPFTCLKYRRLVSSCRRAVKFAAFRALLFFFLVWTLGIIFMLLLLLFALISS